MFTDDRAATQYIQSHYGVPSHLAALARGGDRALTTDGRILGV